jgi:hypothetical protein
MYLTLVACTAVSYKNQSRGHSELDVSLEYWKKSEVLRVIRIKTANRPVWGNFDPILGIFDRTIFSYFSKYQCLPKTVKSFILHLHFFYQAYYPQYFRFFPIFK